MWSLVQGACRYTVALANPSSGGDHPHELHHTPEELAS
jgi:hypothetical protein